MYRLLSIGIVLLWMSAMSALFMRDVYPAWTAQDAPPLTKEQFAKLLEPQQQVGIFDGNGKRRGTAWSDLGTVGGNTAIRGTVYVEDVSLLPAVLVETSTELDEKGELDSFTLNVFGVPATTIQIHGERHGIYFPCEIQMGPLFRQANLEMAASRMLSDSFRPFTYLPTLKVGQSWRMQVVDPVSAALGGGTQFIPVIARVTRRETIEHQGKPTECFVVETSPGQAKAWVGQDGHVYVQEVQLPAVGKMVVREEPYNAEARTQARNAVRTGRGRGDAEGGLKGVPSMKELGDTVRNALKRKGHGGSN
jgi:hypothetical protein